MTPERHAHCARLLIAACGGLVQAGEILGLKKSRMADFQDVTSAAYLNADQICRLEAAAGEPVYSLAMVQAVATARQIEDILTEACEVSEAGSDLQRTVRLAKADGRLDTRERREIRERSQALRRQLDELDAAVDEAEPAS